MRQYAQRALHLKKQHCAGETPCTAVQEEVTAVLCQGDNVQCSAGETEPSAAYQSALACLGA